MLARRSDTDTSDSDENEDQVVNLGLMAQEGQVQKEGTECESSNEVGDSIFVEYCKSESAQAKIFIQNKVLKEGHSKFAI